MRTGIHIGRVFGINIYVDWSWLFIFFLVTWNLATVFSTFHPDWDWGLRWGTAVFAALLFFISVLAHELAHSIVARAKGIPVRNITLFLFGGVSNIQREPPDPGAEFLITIVGPATSIILGIFFIWISGFMSGPMTGSVNNVGDLIAPIGPLATVLLWLGPINLILGFFNLIPGFPLDGGRILRSILWAVTDNLRQATRWAAWVGQAIAWLMIIAGISMIFGIQVPFFGTGLISGLWLAFIGWFLNSASQQSYHQVVIHDLLEDVPVGRIMRANPPTVPPDISISELVSQHVMGTDDHAFPVIDNGHLAGIVTLDDIRGVSRDKWDTTLVREAMTSGDKLIATNSEADAAEALERLQEKDVRQLPVLQNNQLVGMLRRRDIIRWLQLHADARI
ncbi:MAG: site-2 protease family protein [Chloroflexi bacterium]|nr:site-2 protease family protein [Chloroflexota bacterium]